MVHERGQEYWELVPSLSKSGQYAKLKGWVDVFKGRILNHTYEHSEIQYHEAV